VWADADAVSAAVTVLFESATAANRCLAELKRLHSAPTWGDIRVRPLGEHAEMEVPATSWTSCRRTVESFGGRRI
jgi:hypothetical protein